MRRVPTLWAGLLGARTLPHRLHALGVPEMPGVWSEGRAELAPWSEEAWAHVASVEPWERMVLGRQAALGLGGGAGQAPGLRRAPEQGLPSARPPYLGRGL